MQRFSTRRDSPRTSGTPLLRKQPIGAIGLALAAALGATQLVADEADPRSRAAAALSKIEALGAEAELALEPVERARAILKRADEARQGEREQRARLLEEFALEWALTGADLIAAHKLEGKATQLERELTEAETKLRRARALLEETEARRGRAQTDLQRLDPDAAKELAESPAPPTATPTAPTAPEAPPAAPAKGASE